MSLPVERFICIIVMLIVGESWAKSVIVRTFLCGERQIIVEDEDDIKNFVSQLNSRMALQDEDSPIQESNCEARSSYEIPSPDLIENWLGTQFENMELGTKVYIYMQSESPSVYQIMLLGKNRQIRKLLNGCIAVYREKENLRSNVNYVHISSVSERLRQKFGHVSWYEICIAYKNITMNTSDTDSNMTVLYTNYVTYYIVAAFDDLRGNPVILVPGLVSSQIFVETDQSRDRCGSTIWFPDIKLEPAAVVECLRKHKTLNGTWVNYNGQQTRPAPWGDPGSVTDFSLASFAGLTKKLESIGYTSGLSLRAAPYDFRLTPDDSAQFFDDYRNLIQETFKRNNYRKVVLVAHSMGSLFTLHFLNRMTKQWKNKYIKSFVSAAAPWGGSIFAWKFLLYGKFYSTADSLSSFFGFDLKTVAQSWPSILYLLPNNRTYDNSHIVVKTPTRNYTIADQERLFSDTELQHLIPEYRRTLSMTRDFLPPEVEVHCVYSYNCRTDSEYSIKDLKSTDFDTHYEDGDCVVSTQSAKGCLKWSNQQSETVFEKPLNDIRHENVMNDNQIFDYLKNILIQ